MQQFAASRVYLKFNGRPVIFVFGSEVLTPSEWAGIIESLQAEGHQAYFIRNYANFRYYPAFNSFFPWIGAHDIVLNHADPIAWLNQAAEELRAFSESHGIEWGLNVWPGFDSTPVADWCYGLGKIQIDRQGGLLYNKTWNAAIRNSPQWIEISTFNDWNEGTTVEPTIEYHYQYLYATAYYSAQFKHQQPRYDGVPVPLAIYNATLTVRQAENDGRLVGLDLANRTLQQAEQAFQSEKYSDAHRLAEQAIQLASEATIPQVSTTSSSTLMMPLEPVSPTPTSNVTYAVGFIGAVTLVAISVMLIVRKRRIKQR